MKSVSYKRAAALAAASCGLAACPPPEPECGLRKVFELTEREAQFSLDPCTGQLALGGAETPESRLPAAPDGRPALAWADDSLTTAMDQGRFTFAGSFGSWRGLTGFEPAGGSTEPLDRDPWHATGPGTWTSEADPEHRATLIYGAGPRGSLALHLGVAGAERVSVAFGCNDGERFYGLGARPQGTDHTGTSPLLYTAEPGIGQIDYALDEFDILRGRIGDSYYPVPWTLTDRGTGIGMSGTPIARMVLCGADEPGVLRIEAWDDAIDLFLFAAPSAREAVADWTMASGPPAAAPPWAYGPWVAVQRGTEELLRTAEALRAAGVPASALWAQDWIGGGPQIFGGYDLNYHWTWDEELYPELPETITALHEQGFAFLGYFNPFVDEDFAEWDEGSAGGWLVETQTSEIYEFSIVDRHGSMLDLFDSGARDWARGYLDAATAMGQDGWMCDFGEWLPFDARVGAGPGAGPDGADGGEGRPGLLAHNAYPVEWHALNMESLDAAWGPGNALCFGRSGWAGDHSVTPVTWGGDQETSFARDDGMPSAREIGVGLGLSGVGRYGSDIAGFTSVWSDPATKELWFRWVAMGAFEPVMRTHDGLADEENWNWEKDEETTAHFARYASLHMRLQPFWLALDRAYREEGLPFLRHAVLVEPAPATDAADRGAWEALRDAPDQHFLGDSLLVAPVMEEGATSRSVVLPRGRWYSLLDEGESWDGGGGGAGGAASVVTVDAPISEIPVFVRAGSILPMLPAEVVTSYAASDPSVLDTGDRADALDLEVFDGPAGSLTLADGSAWTFSGGAMSWAGGAGAITLDGQPLAPGCADDAASNCLESLDIPNGTATLRIDWGEGPRVLAGKGWELRTSEGGGLSSRLGLRSPPGAGK